ncbi:hypothetical protein D3C73_1430570 [compost metagenome]
MLPAQVVAQHGFGGDWRLFRAVGEDGRGHGLIVPGRAEAGKSVGPGMRVSDLGGRCINPEW